MKKHESNLTAPFGGCKTITCYQCKSCVFRDHRFPDAYKLGCCAIYTNESGEIKPNGISFGNEKCEYYEKEK